MAFVELTEGDLEPHARAACESTLFGRLEATGVATEMVALNATGCFLTVDERDVPRVRTAAASLNVALRLRPACACVTLARAQTNWPLPSLANVLSTFSAYGLEILHIAADPGAVDVVVADSDASLAAEILAGFCRPQVTPRVA
jgi:hypothetical protein